jgi:hypothetical protein
LQIRANSFIAVNWCGRTAHEGCDHHVEMRVGISAHVAHVHLAQMDRAAQLPSALGGNGQHATRQIGAVQLAIMRVVRNVQPGADAGFQNASGHTLADRLSERAFADDFGGNVEDVEDGRDAFVFIARAGVHVVRLLVIESALF